MTEESQGHPGAGDPAKGASPGVHLVTWIGSGEERDALQAWLAEQRLDPQIEWATTSSVSFRLNTSDASAIGELMRGRQDIPWTVVAPGTPDYLLRHLVVEGPDGRSFRLRDVPAATPVGSVGTEVVDQYPVSDTDRPVIVDRVDPSGEYRRINPDTTLAEVGVTEGERLRVGFERRAA